MITSDRNRGAGAARNTGVRAAKGDLLFFLDADILVQRDTLSLAASSFQDHPEISALFCSYRKETIPTNFFSIYKNLLHHYTHQTSQAEAVTFCAGYGAIKKEVFETVGGFDEAYRALEDIELGYRLYQAGHKIFLAKHIQLTHCKYYSFPGLITSDVFHRAIPWTRIMLEKRIYRSDLNTKGHNVLSVVLAFLILFLLPLLPFYPANAVLFAGLWAVLGVLNADFYRFVFREKGGLFLLQTMVMTWFTYIYSGVGLILGILAFLTTRRK